MSRTTRIKFAAAIGGTALLAAAAGQLAFGSGTAAAAPDTPAPNSTTSTAAAKHGHTVTLDGARLTLPAGWKATEEPGGYKNSWIPWCLHKTGSSTCLIEFGRHQGVAGKASLIDVDIEGGLTSNPAWCDGTWTSTGAAGVADFGGREAEHRRWNYQCADGQHQRIEQYEVATSPSYVLYSEHASKQTSAIMRTVAATADLPSQKLPVRLFDRGVIRSAQQTDDGRVKIKLDRDYLNPASSGTPYINNNPKTYSYTIKASQAHRMGVGDQVALKSDGRRVITIDHETASR